MEEFENENGELVTTINLGHVVGPQGSDGEPGPKGDPFKIKKTYESIEAMESDDTDDVSEGDMVIINTDDVEDPDNAKLYVKTSDGWGFITDLSGAQGIKGETGPQGKTGAAGKDGAFASWKTESFTFYYAGIRVNNVDYNDPKFLAFGYEGAVQSITGKFSDRTNTSTVNSTTTEKTLNGYPITVNFAYYQNVPYTSAQSHVNVDVLLEYYWEIVPSSMTQTKISLLFFCDKENLWNTIYFLQSIREIYSEPTGSLQSKFNAFANETLESAKATITKRPFGNGNNWGNAEYTLLSFDITIPKALYQSAKTSSTKSFLLKYY